MRASAEVIFSALTGGGFLVAVSLLGDAPLGLPLCLLVIIALVVGHSASLIARGSPNSFLEVAQKRQHARIVGPFANMDYLLRRVRAKREALSLALRHGYSAIGVEAARMEFAALSHILVNTVVSCTACGFCVPQEMMARCCGLGSLDDQDGDGPTTFHQSCPSCGGARAEFSFGSR